MSSERHDRVESAFDLAIAYQYLLSIHLTELDTSWGNLISGALAHRILSCAHDLSFASSTTFTSFAAQVVKSDYLLLNTFNKLPLEDIQRIMAGAMKLASPLLHQMAAANITRDELAADQIARWDWRDSLATELSGATPRSSALMHKGYCENAVADTLFANLTGDVPSSSLPEVPPLQPDILPRLSTDTQPAPIPLLPPTGPQACPVTVSVTAPHLVTTLDPALDLHIYRLPLAPIHIPTIPVALPLAPPALTSPPTPTPSPQSRPSLTQPRAKRKANESNENTAPSDLTLKPKPAARRRVSDKQGQIIPPKPKTAPKPKAATKPRPQRGRKSESQVDEEETDMGPPLPVPKKTAATRRQSMPANAGAGVPGGTTRSRGRRSLPLQLSRSTPQIGTSVPPGTNL